MEHAYKYNKKKYTSQANTSRGLDLNYVYAQVLNLVQFFCPLGLAHFHHN